MSRIGMATDKSSRPAAALYKLWKDTWGIKGRDYVTRQAFYEWLESEDEIHPLTSHKLFRLGDMLNVSPRWLLYGEHFGAISMESFKSMDEREIQIVEAFRVMNDRGRQLLCDRAQDLLDLHTRLRPLKIKT